jgi:hypothetical protein
MSKQPADRFATCGIFINAALPARYADDRPAASAPAASAGPAGGERDDGGSTRRTPWPLVLAGLGVVLLALVLWLVLNRGDESSATADLPDDTTTVRSEPAADASPTAGTSARPTDPSRWTTEVSDVAVAGLEAMDGMVLAIDEEGVVTLLRPAAGRVSWRAEAGGAPEVAAGSDAVVHGGDELTVVDPRTGEISWNSPQAPTTSLQVTADGTVVGAARTAGDAEVLAVGADDGSERWHVRSPQRGADARLTVEVGDDLVYALQDGRLTAMDPASAVDTAVGRREISSPRWAVDVPSAWPVLAATPDGVALATRDGEVCRYGARDGVVDWCAAVPGTGSEGPHLFATSQGVVAATSHAVIAVDLDMGAPSWSLSPGSPGNVVAVSRAVAVVADGDGGIVGLDPVEGTELFDVDHLGDVTALAAHRRWLVVGTADGRVRRIDIDAVGGG